MGARVKRLLVACIVLAFAAPAAAGREDPFRRRVGGDRAAHEIYRGMFSALRAARTLTLESEYVWETNGSAIGRSRYTLRLKKPNFARLESRSADGARTGVIVLDGREMWIYWPTGRPPIADGDSLAAAGEGGASYMRKAAAAGSHSIGRETSNLGTGMSMPILDPSFFHGLPDPLDELLDAVRSRGSAVVDGETCDVVAAEYQKGQRTRVFWIARRDRLPRRLEETVRLAREIVKREDWRVVDVGGEIPNGTFAYAPPESSREYRLPTLVDGLLPPGSAAPDFEVTLLDGTRFRLSERRGSVVWLCFWRLACPPCRVELPHLDRLHERYGANGLVVVGVNFADDGETARAYLRKERIGFANAADTSAAVKDLYYRRYQTVRGQSAVPLNYIIDREGRIADAWYGYEKGSQAGYRTLRKLGAMN